MAAGIRVLHIIESDQVEEHEMNALARVLEDGRVVYPEEEPEQRDLFHEPTG